MTDPIRREVIAANGLEFECLRCGDGDRLALCLHGFPDDAGSMRPLLKRFAAEGFTAVAPYMRGYGPTGPAPDDDYSATALGSDAIAIAAAHDVDEPVLVGHDWGAVAAYVAARIDPDAFSRIVTMAVPPRFERELFDHPRQLLRSWYVGCFQLPGVAERALRARDFALIEFLWGTWSPGWSYPPGRIESVKDTFRSGETVAASLAYYRQFVRPLARDVVSDGPPPAETDRPGIQVPGLVLAGADDGCIGIECFGNAAAAFDAPVRVAAVEDAGHFLHLERPSVVWDEIAAFVDA